MGATVATTGLWAAWTGLQEIVTRHATLPNTSGQDPTRPTDYPSCDRNVMGKSKPVYPVLHVTAIGRPRACWPGRKQPCLTWVLRLQSHRPFGCSSASLSFMGTFLCTLLCPRPLAFV
ncbi:hypothetical protein P171DRAFT_181801 [Karstenula rhodostoma CBS 690.94]|uniref:Uncharacterized protein n=1 Tax=Karstenula rhodostoma CBS 690.94 TaxID=1392251 RepID=A0A9P4U5S0_9PLEO|nr:hypothetical protein P171DRAFT_181801 [Karstenula rhodostoma CBS 690.94]